MPRYANLRELTFVHLEKRQRGDNDGPAKVTSWEDDRIIEVTGEKLPESSEEFDEFVFTEQAYFRDIANNIGDIDSRMSTTFLLDDLKAGKMFPLERGFFYDKQALVEKFQEVAKTSTSTGRQWKIPDVKLIVTNRKIIGYEK